MSNSINTKLHVITSLVVLSVKKVFSVAFFSFFSVFNFLLKHLCKYNTEKSNLCIAENHCYT